MLTISTTSKIFNLLNLLTLNTFPFLSPLNDNLLKKGLGIALGESISSELSLSTRTGAVPLPA